MESDSSKRYSKEKVKELSLYHGRITPEDVKRIFVNLTKPSTPFLGFLDLSSVFSRSPKFLITKTGNVFNFYLKIKNGSSISRLGPLLFPFRIGKDQEVELIKPKWLPLPKIYPLLTENFVDFMLREDIKHLEFRAYRILGGLFLKGMGITKEGQRTIFLSPSATSFLSTNFEEHPSVYVEFLEPLPKMSAMETRDIPIFEHDGITIGLDNFSPIQHTLVLGESGSGKSVFLMIYLKALMRKYGKDLRIIMIDPHGEFAKRFPGEKKVVDFKDEYIEPLRSTQKHSPMLTQLITQLISSSLGKHNKYAERVIFHSVHLLSSIGKLTLSNMEKLLVDEAVRMEFLSETEVEEVKDFFDREFQNIYIHNFNEAILPVLNFISEYNLYIGKKKKAVELLDCIKNNPITIVSFDPNFFGKTMIKFLGGAIINQMYISAITGKLDKPTLLVIDEFPRVEALAIKDILAETRKFNLFSILTAQYLGQLDKPILDAIIGNSRNIIAFKLHRKDAELLGGMMEIKVEEYFRKAYSVGELEVKKKEMFVRLHQRECIVRLFDGEKYLLPIKVKVVDKEKWIDKT